MNPVFVFLVILAALFVWAFVTIVLFCGEIALKIWKKREEDDEG